MAEGGPPSQLTKKQVKKKKIPKKQEKVFVSGKVVNKRESRQKSYSYCN